MASIVVTLLFSFKRVNYVILKRIYVTFNLTDIYTFVSVMYPSKLNGEVKL